MRIRPEFSISTSVMRHCLRRAKRDCKAIVRPDGAKAEELVIPAFRYKHHVGTDGVSASSGATA